MYAGVGTITGDPAGAYSSTATRSTAITSETGCTRSGSTAQPYSLRIHSAVATPSFSASGGER